MKSKLNKVVKLTEDQHRLLQFIGIIGKFETSSDLLEDMIKIYVEQKKIDISQVS